MNAIGTISKRELWIVAVHRWRLHLQLFYWGFSHCQRFRTSNFKGKTTIKHIFWLSIHLATFWCAAHLSYYYFFFFVSSHNIIACFFLSFPFVLMLPCCCFFSLSFSTLDYSTILFYHCNFIWCEYVVACCLYRGNTNVTLFVFSYFLHSTKIGLKTYIYIFFFLCMMFIDVNVNNDFYAFIK